MSEIITLGEILLRLSPPNHERLIQANKFDVVYGGAEANVAVSLAQYNHDTVMVSKVPDNGIGHAAISHMRRFGVNTDHMVLGGERLGIYYLEPGVNVRASQVIYDRKHSAISEASVDEFDFDAIFKNAKWFHWSGITPALSDTAEALTRKACQVAKKHGVKVSVDLNYRSKLWTRDKAREALRPLMEHVDICIGNEHDVRMLLSNSSQKDEKKTDYSAIAKAYGFTWLVTTIREGESADRNLWSAVAYDGERSFESKQYDIHSIVDRVGGGDAFSAGLIHGLINKYPIKDALAFATAAGALKHTIPGDQNLVSTKEVEQLLEGGSSGKVQR